MGSLVLVLCSTIRNIILKSDIRTLLFGSITSRTTGLCNRQPGAGVVEGLGTFCYGSECDIFFLYGRKIIHGDRSSVAYSILLQGLLQSTTQEILIGSTHCSSYIYILS